MFPNNFREFYNARDDLLKSSKDVEFPCVFREDQDCLSTKASAFFFSVF